MDVAELDVNAVCFGILCNFPQFCGEERAKEAAELVRALYAERKALRADLARVTAERDGAVDADKAILWLKDYVFEDSRKVYTNGARIIPYFRVLQALRDKAYNGLKEDI